MVFSSLVFVFLFLPLTLLTYYSITPKFKNMVLFAMSLLFYSWGEPVLISVMLVSITMNFLFAKAIDYLRTSPRVRAFILGVCVLGNISLLLFFKYANFIISNINRFSHLKLPVLHLLMPIGISFYTFQAMSYVIDVFRGETKANGKLEDVALYVSFFPQLIAGPIVRYKDIDEQLSHREESWPLFNQGAVLFIYGLSKKLILANFTGKIADGIMAMDTLSLHPLTAWLGIIAYTLQIYFDFSGYSTMAIGLGKMFGFHFMENFISPYIARTIQDFWRRWHISLSTWFKDYLYIPLGGNRKGQIRTMVNQFIVFSLCGLWHGASWSFLVWGIYHGGLLSLEKFRPVKSIQNRLPPFISWFLTILLIMVGWVFFRQSTVTGGIRYLGVMFGIGGGNRVYNGENLEVVILLIGIICSYPWHKLAHRKISVTIYRILRLAFLIFLFAVDTILMVTSTYNPFIYYRF